MRANSLGLRPPTVMVAKVDPCAPLECPSGSARWCDVLCSPFVCAQVLGGSILAFGAPLAFFLLFFPAMPVSMRVAITLLSPLLCALLAPLLIPVAWPDATARGWVPILPARYFATATWFFRYARPRRALCRHLILGAYLAVVWLPVGLFVLYAIRDDQPLVFSFWAATYIAGMTASVLPLSILAFSLQPHHERVVAIMSRHPSNARGVLLRVWWAPWC